MDRAEQGVAAGVAAVLTAGLGNAAYHVLVGNWLLAVVTGVATLVGIWASRSIFGGR